MHLPASRLLKIALAQLLLAVLPASRANATMAESRRLRLRIPPVYPEVARRMHLQDTIVLSISVDASGNVKDAIVVSGHPMLAVAAREAVLHWRYTSAATPKVFRIEVVFRIPG